MKALPSALVLATLAFTGCNRASHDSDRPPGETKPPITATPLPAPSPVPSALRREEMLARIQKLTNDDCDLLVLQFQIIPRDEILNPISEPRKELIRYVKRLAPAEDLASIDRAIEERIRRAERPKK